MYKYEEPSLFSGRRGAAFLAVILLHVLMVWAFYTGLAGKLVQTIIPPVEIAQIDKPKDVDKPPPPPPKLEEIKPYVPPPEFVDIQAPQVETTAITQITQTNKPPPAPVVTAPPRARHADSTRSQASAEDRRRVLSRCIEARQRRGPMHRADDGVRGRQDHQRIDSDDFGLPALG
jgi:type IV secretory pathway VirB10-like protein